MAAQKADWFRANDPRVETLDRLLEQRAVPFGGLGLESLDGFLSALAVAPVAEDIHDWFDAVWGKAPPRWDGADDEANARGLLALAWETARRRVRKADEDYTLEDALLWWLPDEPDAAHGDEVDIGAAWAGGFLQAMDRHSEAWDAWIAQDDWIGEVEGYLDGLAVGSYPAQEEGGPPVPLTYRERLEIFAGLPDMLHDLYCHRLEALTPREPVRRAASPDRNDPCPCGSGRKFKKCCSA